tara:strand:+ start:68 stop:949 length:882 start_codon:yes stop_codon:yes gene_type:complete
MKIIKFSKFANPDVLKFYEELPFNYYSSVEKQAEKIRNGEKNLNIYGPLNDELKKSKKIIDIGCGAGYLTNSISFVYPDKSVLGIDFNEIAINRANEVSKFLKLNSLFETHDVFKFTPSTKYDLAISIGVLMHTYDCFEGLRYIIKNVINKKGKLYIGLYNSYGRKPFLNYFKKLKEDKLSENEIFNKYAELHKNLKDTTHLKSWYRDQVLHPYETQFSIKEVINILDKENFKITYTSINKFDKIFYNSETGYKKDQLEHIYNLEKDMEKIGNEALANKRYYPGFFTFLAESK